MPADNAVLPDVQPFSLLESVMWQLDHDPSLHSRLISIVGLEGTPDRQVLRDRLERITRTVPRFRHRVADNPIPGLRPHWELDPHFDMDFHLQEVSLAGTPDEDAVHRFAARVGQEIFHPHRPLWRVYLVTGLADGRAALITKVHHVITDGVGGLQMAAQLFDLSDKGRSDHELGPMPEALIPRPRSSADRFIQGLTQEVGDAGDLVSGALTTIRSNIAPRTAASTAAESARAAAGWVDRRGGAPRQRPYSHVDHYLRVEAPLDRLRAAAHVGGGKLNDAYLAVLVGAVRRYNTAHGIEQPVLHFGMPVNTRREGNSQGGNEFTSQRLSIPAHITDPAERIATIRARTLAGRSNGSDLVARSLVLAAGRLPGQVVRTVSASLAEGLDLNTTNVPGLPVPIYLGGALVTSFNAFIPRLRAPGSSALVSYNGTAHIGLNVDPATVPDVEVFEGCVREELAAVLTLAGE